MAEAKRRLAAILAADAAGYSRLMGLDEASTIATLHDSRALFRTAIEARRGRVVDTTGDSVLAVFDSLVEAVHAAIEVQDALAERNAERPPDRRMAFRIGVNLGDIVEQDDGTVYGDGVNVAARLESLAEPGGVMVSDLARQAIGEKLDVELADAGKHTVKNISEPVRAYAVVRGGGSGLAHALTGDKKTRIFVAAFTVVALAFAGIVAWQSYAFLKRSADQGVETVASAEDEGLALPNGPSIAVLPFENLSSDPDKDFFADGVTEEIITALTRFSDLFVLARNTTFQFKGQPVDIDQLREELGVRYVLQGSVRRAGDQVRVSVQLVQASDGAQLWADSYERDLSADGIFAIQDQITEKIVGTIAGAHGVMARAAETSVRAVPPENLDAYECVLRVHALRRSITVEGREEAQACLERAVELEPTYSDAWASLALVHVLEYGSDSDAKPESLERGLEAARRAVELAPTSAWAHLALARALFFQDDLDQAIDEALEAVALNPMNADIVGTAGYYIAFAGESDTGRALIERAIALNPVYPTWYLIPEFYAHYSNRDFDRALEAAKASAGGGSSWRSHMRLAIAYAQSGDQASSAQAVAELLTAKPDFVAFVGDWMRRWNFDPEAANHVIDGLRKAGLAIPDLAVSG